MMPSSNGAIGNAAGPSDSITSSSASAAVYRHDVILDIEGGSLPSGSRCSSHTSLTSLLSSSNSATLPASGCSSTSSSSQGSAQSSAGGGGKFVNRLSCSYCLMRLQGRVCSPRAILLPLVAVCAFVSLYWYGSGYMKRVLFWIETQNAWLTFAVFMCFFAVVSFPLVVGYLVLIITSGYLFGCVKGLVTVVVGANLGVAIAHNTIRAMQSRLPLQRLLKNETAKAILRVISGPRAFKVVLLARLTPIPFGLQNTIFGVSNVQPRAYHLATLLGLFPAQLINVYIGSSLRSMHDVLHNHNTAMTSYAVFAVQICIGAVLMTWVIHKARRELSEALLTEIDSDYKVIVEVQS